MNKPVRTLLALLSCAATAHGGMELMLNAGYGFAAGRDFTFAAWQGAGMLAPSPGIPVNATGHDSAGVTVFTAWDEAYASAGNGLQIDAAAVYYVSEDFGLLVRGGYVTMGGFATASTAPVTSGGVTVETKSTYALRANCIPINVGVKIRSRFGRCVPYLYLTSGIYLPTLSSQTDYSPAMTSTTGAAVEQVGMTAKLTPGIGFTGGAGVVVKVGGAFGLTLELSPTYAFSQISQVTYTMRDRTSGQVGTLTFVYQNNTPTVPAGTTDASGQNQTVYQHSRPTVSFSSFAVRSGIVIGF